MPWLPNGEHWRRPIKWFKHMADASNDDFMEELEEKFGLEGYARWWKTLEIIAKSMDKNPAFPGAIHTVDKWCQFLKCKRKVLLSFLEHSGNKSKMKWKQNENIITIEIPNILKLRDEYYRKSGHTPEHSAPEAEANKDKELNTTPLPPNEDSEMQEKIEIPKHNLKPKKKELNNIDFDAAAAACCSIIQRRLLAPSDALLLKQWLTHYDFHGFIMPIIAEKAVRHQNNHFGKAPASLQYFKDAIEEAGRAAP